MSDKDWLLQLLDPYIQFAIKYQSILLIAFGTGIGLLALNTHLNNVELARIANHESVNLVDKVVILTGASSGVGVETALDLASRGATVVLATYDKNTADRVIDYIKVKVPTAKVYFQMLDLSSLDSVRNFVHAFTEEKLHILINNADIMCCPRLSTTMDGFEYHLGVNHIGHFLLTQMFLSLLEESSPSRVINVTSSFHIDGDGDMHFDDINLDDVPYIPWKAYHRSKVANMLFTDELARRLKYRGVVAYCVNPGTVRSSVLRYHSLRWYYYILYPLIAWTSYFMSNSPEQAAKTIIYCAVAPELETEHGLFFEKCRAVAKPSYCTVAKAKMLWKLSEQLIGLSTAF